MHCTAILLVSRLGGKETQAVRLAFSGEGVLTVDGGQFAEYVLPALGEGYRCGLGKMGKRAHFTAEEAYQ